MAKKRRTRPNPKTFSIIDKCPGCDREFGWDACVDEYVGARIESAEVNKGLTNHRELVLSICPDCDAVIAVEVLDNRGGEVYVPSQKDL